MNSSVFVGIVFRGHKLCPIVCRFCQHRKKNILLKHHISLLFKFGNILVCYVEHGFERIQIKFVAKRNLNISVNKQGLVQRLNHPRRACVPISKRVWVTGFGNYRLVAVGVYRCLNSVCKAVSCKRIFLPIGELTKNEISISYRS